MPDVEKAVAAAQLQAPQTAKADFEYVTIPERDRIMDWKHPNIMLNGQEWGPGKHLVSPEHAAYIRDRLEVYEQSLIRLLNPKPKQNMNTSNPQIRTHYADDHSPVVR